MPDQPILFVDYVPEMVAEGDLVHVFVRSGDRMMRLTIRRRDFSKAVDKALGILTGPRARGAVVKIVGEGRED